MKLSYFCCKNLTDSAALNIRAPSKKEAKRLRESYGSAENLTKPFRVTIEYESGFDLLFRCLSEGRLVENEIEWEQPPTKEKK